MVVADLTRVQTAYTPAPTSEWRQYNVILDPELHRRVKMLAAFNRLTLTQAFTNALQDWLEKQTWPSDDPSK